MTGPIIGQSEPRLSEFQKLLNILSCKNYDFDTDLVDPYHILLSALRDALSKEIILDEEIWTAIFNRRLSVTQKREYLSLKQWGPIDYLEWLQHNDFIRDFPQRVSKEYHLNLRHYVHIPRTGGSTLLHNISKKTYFSVWSVDDNPAPEFVYTEIVSFLAKIKKNNLLVTHSHHHLPQILGKFPFSNEDEIIILIRDPLTLHLSNAVYIYWRIANDLSLDKNSSPLTLDKSPINPGWTNFFDIVKFAKSPAEAIVEILESNSYILEYGNLIQRYIFGDDYKIDDNINLYLKQIKEIYPVIDIKMINDHLAKKYLISEPININSTKSDHINLNYVKANSNLERLIGNDRQIYDYLIDNKA